MKWYVASLADGDTHLVVTTAEPEVATAVCGKHVSRPLRVLDGNPADPLQVCAACVTEGVRLVSRPGTRRVARRPTDGGVVLIRLKPGIVGESRRVVHAVAPLHGDELPDVLTTHCGERIEPGTADLLDRPTGAPCPACVLAATPPAPAVGEPPAVKGGKTPSVDS